MLEKKRKGVIIQKVKKDDNISVKNIKKCYNRKKQNLGDNKKAE